MPEANPPTDDPSRPAPGPVAAPPARSVWRKVIYGGLGCLTLVVLVVGATVAWNARRIANALQGGAADLSELMAVRNALVGRYRTPDVTVQWMTRAQFSVKDGGRSSGRRLVVRMTHPPVLKETGLDEAEDIAREVAAVARGALKDPSTASTVDVVLARKTGWGVTFVENRAFSFTADEITGGR